MMHMTGITATLPAGIAMSIIVACSGATGDSIAEPTPTPTSVQPSDRSMVKASAPIVSALVLTLESFPPQYRMEVTSGLRNGCVEFDGYRVGREGGTITVTMTNLEPADEGTLCTDDYRTVVTSIPLGSGLDLDPGTTYTVLVNDVTTTFVTEGETPEPGQVAAAFGRPFQLEVGQTALVDRQGPQIDFVEVVEDSRCATGVTCIWAGRARIRIRVSSPGDVLGFGGPDLTLEAGLEDPETNTVAGVFAHYLFELRSLDPYPHIDASETPDYTATLVVTRTAR